MLSHLKNAFRLNLTKAPVFNMATKNNSAFNNTAETNSFLDAVKQRRTIYSQSKDIKVSDARIQEIVEFCVKHVPSSFNVQSGRAKILLGKEHDKFWNGTREILRGIVPADKFGPTNSKMDSFAAGYGTVLFFEDQDNIKAQQEQFPLYAQNFPTWSEQSSGMIQYAVWTALEAEGLGCSLQHYSPLVDGMIQKQWNVPSNWKLIAQMPFGHPTAPPGEKTFKPIEERVFVHKS